MKKALSFLVLLILLSVSVFAGFESSTRITIKSSESGFNAPDGVWVLSFIDDGFTTDKVNAKFNDMEAESGEQAKQDFSISVDGTENYCQYDIAREADRLDVVKLSVFYTSDYYNRFTMTPLEKAVELANENGCYESDDYSSGYPLYYIDYGIYLQFWCYKETEELGKIGSLQNKKTITETKWTVQPDGKSAQSATISNTNTGSGRTSSIGDDVKIRWQGLLSSGESCPLSSETLASWNGKWKIIDRFNYRDYETFMRNSLDQELKNVADKARTIDGLEQMINTKADKAVQERKFTDYNPVASGTSINNGKVTVDLARQIVFPQFTMFVDSDYLELEIPVGVPKISCPSKVDFSIGDLKEGQMEITAKNVGSETGSFEMTVSECTSSFEAGDSIAFRLDAGESETKTLLTSATLSEGSSVTGECKIQLKETSSGQTSTCNVKLEADSPEECVEGRKSCGYKNGLSVIKECTDGKSYDIITTCAKGQTCDYSGSDYFCTGTSEGTVSETCKPTVSIGNFIIVPSFESRETTFFERYLVNPLNPFSFKNWGKTDTSCLDGFGLTAFILAIIVFLGLPFIIDKKMRDWKNKNRVLNFTLGFVISLLAYILVLNFFWWGVGILLLLGLILVFIRRLTR